MELPPRLYRSLIRPAWSTNRYITDTICRYFDLKNKHILDFGCGVGAACKLVDPEFYVGVDSCPERVRFAQKLYPNYNFLVNTEYQLPVQPESIDIILIIAVLHHISTDDAVEYLREFRRVLKPNGFIIVMEPQFDRKYPLSNWYMSRFDQGKFIRTELEYLELFTSLQFTPRVEHRFRKLMLYRELLFSAAIT